MAAQVVGVDLRQPLSVLQRDEIYAAFSESQLLVFRQQSLGKQEQVDFSQQFGTLERHARRNQGTEEFPLLHVVNNLGPDGELGQMKSTRWHTDKSFRPAPSLATLLHAVELPPNGGDTCFANMYAAYEALPEARKAALASLRVVHSWEHSRDNVGVELSREELDDAPPMSHPLVRSNPETGRCALFLGMHAAYIDGMSYAQGHELILELEAHATKDEFVYRHRWREGDLLMWDNRCLLHRADSNFDTHHYRRVMHRTCLRGTPTPGQAIAAAPVF
jgi:alpha-ketoglutarate-dependent taurine dioxygenase